MKHSQDANRPGANPVFSGLYRERARPGRVGYVLKVDAGLIAWRGRRGDLSSALMGVQTFMERFERAPEGVVFSNHE